MTKIVSVIISVYKKKRELEILLTAFSMQTYTDFDVIIADDGSGEKILEFINEFRKNCKYTITFLTQEDIGFRKNKILNEAIKTTESDYLIFLDSDCIPHKDFVKAHIENSEENTVLFGRRVFLNKNLSDKLNTEYILSGKLNNLNYKALLSSLNLNHPSSAAEEGLIIENKFLRKLFGLEKGMLVGCNFSASKSLLLKVNGFDEDYTGAGIGEDTDIEYRLGLINAKFKSVRNLAVVFHIDHPKTVENNSNYDYFHYNVKTKNNYFCENGIIKTSSNNQG